MKDESRLSISAFFPAYNDAHTIVSLVRGIAGIFTGLGADFEVVVVNDGSRDKTGEILEELKRKIPELIVIHHPVNRGYGAALTSGFYSCAKDWIFYTDGDGQYDVGEFPSLLAEVRPGVDVVNGYKISRSDPFYRIWLGKLYLLGIHWTFGLKIRDVDCDYRLMRREIFDRIQLYSDSGVICVELMKKIERAGYRIVEVPVHHYPRRHGRSEFFRLRHLSRVCLQLVRLWTRLIWLRRYQDKPAAVPRAARTE
ncbi:MAG: glycosyltransferase family 2 protein [Acidobacteria bacterium]|nr:glycosyltransferase family 2 protein [Acidobacteriota bacterium]